MSVLAMSITDSEEVFPGFTVNVGIDDADVLVFLSHVRQISFFAAERKLKAESTTLHLLLNFWGSHPSLIIGSLFLL